jgi:integrase
MPDWIALAILFAGVMGLREGECVGLQRADIDLDRQQLTVKHSVKPVKDKHGKRKLLLGKPKTESSVRTLPIPEFLTPMVAAHLDRFTSARSDDMVFASPHTGGLVSGQTLRNLFYKARDAATPQLKGMSFHDLRDTALSHLAENGASLGTLMAQAGHTNINTAAIYQQPTEANQRKAYESLETQFEPTTDSKPVGTDQNVDVLKLCAMLQALPLTVQADTLSALPTDVRAAVVMEMSKNE